MDRQTGRQDQCIATYDNNKECTKLEAKNVQIYNLVKTMRRTISDVCVSS